MKVSLVVVDGKHQGKEIPLKRSRFIVGRDARCDLRPNSPTISNCHCVLEVGECAVTLRDLGSKNGTFLNGERVTGTTEVRKGDLIRIGPLQFQIMITVPLAAKTGKPEQALEDDLLQWLDDEDEATPAVTPSMTETATDVSLPAAKLRGDEDTVPESEAAKPRDAAEAASDIIKSMMIRRTK